MEIQGYIVDSKTGDIVTESGTIDLFRKDDFFTAPFEITDGTYKVWTDKNPSEVFVHFKFNGYKNIALSIETLYNQNGVVQLEKMSAISIAVVLLIIGAVYIYRGKSGKIGKLSTGDVLPIFLLVGGVIAFSVIKQVLESLGIWDSKDTKELDFASSDPNSFWNPNYWQTINPYNKPWTYAINETTAADWCNDIYNSFGAFNDNEERVIGIFKRCRTKANASFIAWKFQRMFNEDLLYYLRGGIWPSDRLSDNDVNTINQYISNLPNF